ncbi:heparinase II/III family protein, partial [bacterium]|nr:heparinase II/III family protein [bacterium]
MADRVKLAWAARRLRAMSPAEVAIRGTRAIRNRARRPRHARSTLEVLPFERAVEAGRLSAGTATADGVARALDETRALLLPGARNREELVAGLMFVGSSTARTVAAADSVIGGVVPAFGWMHFETSYPPRWLVDPSAGGEWPADYWAELDFRFQDGLDDPRYVWELNRQHELVTLGRAFVLTGDDRYATAVWASMRSWVDQNPPFFGVNWTSALEVGIRLVSWALAVDLVGTVGATEDDIRSVVSSVALQAGHLSDNLSVYASSRNNHLIGEAAGLLVAGTKFRFLKGADGWRRTGRQHVVRETIRQVTDGGVPKEQALHYGSFVIEFALVSAAALRAEGGKLPEPVGARLAAMAEFLCAVAAPDGEVPEIGDADGGRVYDLSDCAGRQTLRAAACAALEAGTALPEVVESGDLEPALWLSGPESVRSVLATRSPPGKRESKAFPDGGYFVLARAGQHGVVDCGELGYLSIAAHGHADCLTVCLAVDGRWLVVDPGTFCYHRSRDWRDHFRSTVAHNTVAIDGRNQSEMIGPFMWGTRAAPTQGVWLTTLLADIFEGSHDGYAGTSGVVHRRAVSLLASGVWVIVDRLEGVGRHMISSGFQLAAGASVSRMKAASASEVAAGTAVRATGASAALGAGPLFSVDDGH